MIIYNHGPCQYLEDEQWSLRLKSKNEGIPTPSEIDSDLKKGWSLFSGVSVKPECKSCNACQPYRVKADEFKLSKSLNRVVKKCKDVKVVVKDADYCSERFSLYLKHGKWRSNTRGWNKEYARSAERSFRDNFTEGPKGLKSINFYLNNKLVCVNYLIATKTTCYSMYTYYDPDYLKYSLGMFAILTGIQFCKDLNFKHLYMGFYVEGCQSLSYKDRFKPSETYNLATKKWSGHE